MEGHEDILTCSDIACKSQEHREKIDYLSGDLLNILNEATHETLPSAVVKSALPRKSRPHCLPGWKEFVEPYQEGARFWHSVWLCAGKPQNTELHRLMKHTRNKYHYQIRRCKRVGEMIRNNKLAENCFTNDLDLFSELKKQRKHACDENITIDGVEENKVPEVFANVYGQLYNKNKDDTNMDSFKSKVIANINQDQKFEIEKINSLLIKQALAKIKPKKSDPLYDFSSDCLKNAPDIFHEYLAALIRSYFIHGHITNALLTATLVPIVKDKLGDLSDSKNYRSIAISSLVLKLIDWIVIIKYGHLLKVDDFQFGFQPASNTSLCSWMVFETIDSYIRNGSIVYGCLLDCTKAFDTVEHDKLFEKLWKAGLPAVVLRLLIYIYRNQTAKVRWKSGISEEFLIRNGVRQGAVISPLLFSVYMDDLFKILRDTGSGCMVGSYYAGCYGYADDLFFICPSRKGLQEMLDKAEIYVKEHSIVFSTNPDASKSKTKGIIFSRKELRFEPEPLILNGNPLPWVKKSKYLGNEIDHIPNGLSRDTMYKRARYIERNMELNQEFPFAHPEVKCKLNRIYNSSFPGSVLYDLTSESIHRLVNTWSISVRNMWELPYNAHRWLIEPLSGEHAHSMLISRFVKFIQNIRKSPKIAVQFMLNKVVRNYDTVTGRNIEHIQRLIGPKTDLFKISKKDIKLKVAFCEMNKKDIWKINLIKEVTNIKQGKLSLDSVFENDNLLSKDELKCIIDFVSTC